jgi:hypothetical protein
VGQHYPSMGQRGHALSQHRHAVGQRELGSGGGVV